MLALGFYFAPQNSFILFTRVFTCVLSMFLLDIGLGKYVEQVTNIEPCEHAVRDLIVETVADVLYLICRKIVNAKVFISCDGANKGLHIMIKKISFWYFKDNNLITYNLDSDTCVGTDRKVAEAIDFSLKKVDPIGSKITFNSGTTDAGGGGTSLRLARDLKAVGRIINEFFFSLTCCLHGHSLSFFSPVKKYFLLCKLSNRTVLQLLFTMYAI